MTKQETITRIISVYTNHHQMWHYPKPLEQRDERESLELEINSQYMGSFLCSFFLLEAGGKEPCLHSGGVILRGIEPPLLYRWLKWYWLKWFRLKWRWKYLGNFYFWPFTHFTTVFCPLQLFPSWANHDLGPTPSTVPRFPTYLLGPAASVLPESPSASAGLWAHAINILCVREDAAAWTCWPK